jgi:glycosyltransferase involved in cell wall biosynthesis
MYCHICSHTGIDTLVTVSDYSAQMIKDRTKTNRDIQVLFAAEKTRPSAEAFAVEGIDFKTDSYLLVVNAGRIEKNAASAIVAFDSLLQDSDFAAANSKLKLVVVGINDINDLGLRNILSSSRVVVVPYLSASRYEYILSKSSGLIYPSFSEGFGYPPVEAMSLGIPCVVSSNTSIPEVCGDVGIYCDPFDLESIKAAIKRMISSPPDKNALNDHACKIKLRQNRDLLNLTHLICGDPKNK